MRKLKMLAPLSVVLIAILSSCGTGRQEPSVQKTIEKQPVPAVATGTVESTGTSIPQNLASWSIVSSSWSTSSWSSSLDKKLITSSPYEKYTLSQDERTEFSKVMGIELPKSIEWLGELFLNVDWDSKGNTGKSTSIADNWRKISLWFSKLYSDDIGGWGRGFIEYSTYDFQIGSEYNTFATKNDFESIKSGKNTKIITVDGMKWIVTYKFEVSYNTPSKIQKIVVFPFSDHYIAIVYTLSGDYSKEGNAAIKRLNDGKYLENETSELKQIDNFISSLKFLNENQ